MHLEHYLGQKIEIIYEDRHGEVTQRHIVVRSIRDGVINATCMKAKAWRPFRIDRILSWQPVKGRTA
jgi:predicted DNA-binding transcriptional regulator YafY